MKPKRRALAALIFLPVLLGPFPRSAGTAAAGDAVLSSGESPGPGIDSVSASAFVLPPTLEREPGVNDPVFSILARLVTSGTYGTLTQERLQQEVARIGGQSRLPYESVISITREPVRPGWTALIRIEFKKPIDLPVPYSILGYHPGSFSASQHCLFREWEVGKIQLVETEEKDGRTVNRLINLEDVHLFAAIEGEVKIDIDAIVDALLGGAIDDTDVTALMLCRWEGEWYGVAMGYGRDRTGRSGILSLRRDKILFPPPEGLRGVGRQMRARAELLGRVWDAGGAGLEGPARWKFDKHSAGASTGASTGADDGAGPGDATK